MKENNSRLIDQEARSCAVTDLDTTCVVEAGAGTGKTTILIERILSVIRERGTPLTRVVAITFTEKAAGELKAKLRGRLEEEAAEDPKSDNVYRKALRELESMSVGTIHSFCRELIYQRPVEAGVDPGFMVADEQTSARLQDDFWQAWLAEELDRTDTPLKLLMEKGVPVDSGNNHLSLRTLLKKILERREDLGEIHVPCSSEENLLGQIRDFAADLRAKLEVTGSCLNSEDTLAVQIETVRQWLSKGNIDDLWAAERWLEAAPAMNGNRSGAVKNWKDKDTLEEARAAFIKKDTGFFVKRNELLGEILSLRAAPVVRRLIEAAKSYTEYRRRFRVLDFQDLLVCARDMLRDSVSAREYYKSRFDFILVDEFQDTDPLQTEIVFYLCEPKKSCAPDWREIVPEPGKLFIVGDPKQSIYRFRRADLDLYGFIRQRIEAVGTCLNIRVNFRSRPAVLDEVDGLFAEWMTGPRGNRYEPEHVALEKFHPEPECGPQTVFLTPPQGFTSEKKLVAETAAAEAACIAEYIAEITEEGVQQPLSFRDVAVLFRSRTHLETLESAFTARGIPFQSGGGTEFIGRVEIASLRSVLAALDNPYDRVNVVGALRSPFFSCSDAELIEHRISGGEFDYLKEEGSGHLAQCFGKLRRLYEMRLRRSPADVIAKIFAETAGLQLFALKPNGENRVANLLYLFDAAQTLEEHGIRTLRGLLNWWSRLEKLPVREEEPPVAEAGDDFVRLLTFHKAKGLEFSVVILYGLHTKQRVEREPVINPQSKAMGISLTDSVSTPGYAQAQEEEIDRQECENIRLLYVAMTRARERLVIPAYWKKSDSGFYRYLLKRFPRGEDGLPEVRGTRFSLHNTDDYPLEEREPEPFRLSLKEDKSVAIGDGDLAERTNWQNRRDHALQALDRFSLFKTASRHDRHGESIAAKDIAFVPRNATAFGTLVHALLEKLDLPHGRELEEILRLESQAGDFTPAELDQARSLVLKFLESELAARIARSPRLFRELNYTVERNGVIYDGAMDLVFFENNRPVIVDFKTDRVHGEAASARAREHLPQLKAYVTALEAVTGEQVGEAVIHFLIPDRTVSFDRDALLSC